MALSRDYWVDYAKAIGIVLVVFGHVLRGIFESGIPLSGSFYHYSDSIVYSFHMPLFFFLSGLFFFDSFKKRGPISFMANKVDTVVYPYFVWSIIQLSFAILLSQYTNHPSNLNTLVSILWEPAGQFWFLYALFFFFLFSIVIFYKKFTASLTLACVGALILYLFPPLLELDGMILIYFSTYYLFFLLGAVFRKLDDISFLGQPKWIGSLFAVFLLSQYFFHFVMDMHFEQRGVFTLWLAVIGILLVVSISVWAAQKPSKWCLYLGSSSMAIYVMHILTGSGVRVILDKFFGVDSFVIHLVVGFSAGLIVPLIALYLFNRFRLSYVFSAPISKLVLPKT